MAHGRAERDFRSAAGLQHPRAEGAGRDHTRQRPAGAHHHPAPYRPREGCRQDPGRRQAAATAPTRTTEPSRVGRLLDLVRKLIDYGKELAATIRRRAFTDPSSIICCFGTADVALILARIARGLHRANALEARLIRSADRLDAAPPAAPSQPRPRAPRPTVAPAAAETDPRLARLPTPAQIAAEVRRRPIGAVIADICRDLGIMPSHPLWRELQHLIIRYGGNMAKLVKTILDRAFPYPAASGPPAWPGVSLQSTGPFSTGPPP